MKQREKSDRIQTNNSGSRDEDKKTDIRMNSLKVTRGTSHQNIPHFGGEQQIDVGESTSTFTKVEEKKVSVEGQRIMLTNSDGLSNIQGNSQLNAYK